MENSKFCFAYAPSETAEPNPIHENNKVVEMSARMRGSYNACDSSVAVPSSSEYTFAMVWIANTMEVDKLGVLVEGTSTEERCWYLFRLWRRPEPP